MFGKGQQTLWCDVKSATVFVVIVLVRRVLCVKRVGLLYIGILNGGLV